MATLGMHRDFLMEFAALEKPVQKRVFEVFEKFAAATHAGLHLEKLTHQKDPRLRTIRITECPNTCNITEYSRLASLKKFTSKPNREAEAQIILSRL